jgi:drug/metabolite transporter (DMT)-like permease
VIGTKKLTPRLDTLTIQFWQAAIAAVALAPTLLLGGHTVPHGGDIGFVVLLGTLFTAVTCSAYVWLLHRVTAQAAGVLSYLEPVSASLLAWALLGQHIGWAVVFGGALVLGAGFLVVWYEPPDTAALERAGRRLPAPEPAVAPSRGA